MAFLKKIIFENLRPNISEAIKESCNTLDVRIYNIANEVHHITTSGVEPGVEIAQDLSRIIDKTIKEAVALDCDMSVITKGILLGAFRSSPFIRQEAHKTIRILIKEILQSVFKYNGDILKAVEGTLAAIVITAKEFKLNVQEALVVAKEDILLAVKSTKPEFVDDIQKVLSNTDDSFWG